MLWRHGQTDFNVAGKVQGIVDVALNEVGRTQADAAARVLVERYTPLYVVTSDLTRARETAEALTAHTDATIQVSEQARERAFGVLEGLTAKDMRYRFADFYEEWRRTGECAAAGIESRRDVGVRMADLIREQYQATPAGHTLVVVSHGSALTQGLVSLLGLDPSAWAGIRGLDNCHWAEVVAAERAPGWRVSAYNIGADEAAEPAGH